MAEIRDVRGKQQALDSRTHRVEEIQAQVARLERAMAEEEDRGAPRRWVGSSDDALTLAE